MTQDNSLQILKLLKFSPETHGYKIELIQRRKDVSTLGRSACLVTSFIISSKDGWEAKLPIIKSICDALKCRALINLTRFNFEKVAKISNEKVAHYFTLNSYKPVKSAYDKSIGSSKSTDQKDRYWIIDYDGYEEEGFHLDDLLKFIGDKVVTVVPSLSGFSVVIKPHDTRDLMLKYNKIVLYKNSPVNLYIPDFNNQD